MLWLLAGCAAASLLAGELTYEVHVPNTPCDGFTCANMQKPGGDGRGSCPLRVSAVVGFTGTGQTATIFLPLRKGGSGMCQSLEVESVNGTLGSRVQSAVVSKRVPPGESEEVGLDVAVTFEPSSFREQFVNVTYVCGGGLWHYSVFNGHAVAAHVYRVGLVLLSQSDLLPIVTARVLFPFGIAREQLFTDAAIPSVNTTSRNHTVFRFDATNVYSFALAFSFDQTAYLQCGDSSLLSQFIKYGVVGGAIVGGIALCAAVAWFIVKRVIKKKVSPPSFELLGDQFDVLTDGETSQSEMENVNDSRGL